MSGNLTLSLEHNLEHITEVKPPIRLVFKRYQEMVKRCKNVKWVVEYPVIHEVDLVNARKLPC